MLLHTHRQVNYRSIFEIYMESAYFAHEWNTFFEKHTGFCSRNGHQYVFQSESYAAYIQKIGTQDADAVLSQTMTDERIEKLFNSGYSTKQVFDILIAQLMEMDGAQIMQIEDKSHAFCSEALLVQFMRGVSSEETTKILNMQISEDERVSRIWSLRGEEIYKLATSYVSKGNYKTVCVNAKRTPDGNFLDDKGAVYQYLHSRLLKK